MKSIAVIGNGESGKRIADALAQCDKEIVIVHPKQNIVEVNGVKYIQKEERAYRGSSRLHSFLMASLAMGGMLPKMPKPPNVDIPTEYGLVQLKKSRLSANQRAWVVRQFELNFTKLDETKR